MLIHSEFRDSRAILSYGNRSRESVNVRNRLIVNFIRCRTLINTGSISYFSYKYHREIVTF